MTVSLSLINLVVGVVFVSSAIYRAKYLLSDLVTRAQLAFSSYHHSWSNSSSEQL